VVKIEEKFPANMYFYIDKDSNSSFDGVKRHIHNLFEIYYMIDGRCDYYIGGKIYDVKSGDVILIPPGIFHKNSYNCKKHTRVTIHFSNLYIPATVLPYISNDIVLYRNDKTIPTISGLIEKMHGEFKNCDCFSDEIIRNYMSIFFLIISRNREKREDVKVLNADIEMVKRHIRNNYFAKITLQEMAEMIHVSAEHLSRMFRAETGFGFCEYVNLVRLDRASALLREKHKSITSAAYECGFNDSNYFSVKFKKMYGISPKDYKKHNT